MPDVISDTALAALASELIDDENAKAKTYPPCYEFQTMGFHLKNMDTMRTRFTRAAHKFASEQKAVAPPSHFLCQHCFLRHAIDVEGINQQIWPDPDPRNRSANYDHLILGILAKDPEGAASAGTNYGNAFSHNSEVEFWDLINSDPTPPPDPSTQAKTPSTAASSGSTSASKPTTA